MRLIQNVLEKIQPGMKIYYETPQTRDKYVQGAKVLEADLKQLTLRVETQGREVILGEGTRIDISA